VKGDVQHTFHSPHPLIFQTEGAGGIHLEGALTNTGCGPIQLSAPHITITGKLMGQDLNIQGGLTCHGELYGKNLTVLAKGDGEISGKVITDGGHCYWKGGKTLRLTGEWGHLGGGRFHLEGMRNLFIEEGGHLYATNRTTCFTIQNLGGIFSIEKGRVSAGSAPLYISGDCGAVSLEGGLLESMAPITIDVGHHCHLCQSHLTSPQSIHLTLGEDLLLMEGSSLSSPQGIQVNAKERVTLFDTSSISGRGVTINCGETLSLFESATIKGGSSPLFASAGEMLHLEGPQVRIEGGQVSLHAGESFSMEGRSQIASTLGNLSVTAGTTAQLGQEAKISAYGGDLEFIVNEGNLYLYGESALLSPTHGSQIIIGKSLIMEDFSQIQNHGEKGTTIIVDHLGRDGGIVMGPHTSISTGHSPLQIFSAKRHLSTLNGMLNGYRFSPSLLYLNTEYEQWGVSYPSPSSSALFTLFHKENGLITIHPNQHVNQTDFRQILINYIGPFTAELQRDLHPYDEFTSQSITFTNEDEPYFIRRRNEQKDDMD
ncbi:MAG: hypothetical protein KDK64_02495, partial [Chlamydiia bacterium]|nr:hypothetical protein [Chlamydiia bacterium]